MSPKIRPFTPSERFMWYVWRHQPKGWFFYNVKDWNTDQWSDIPSEDPEPEHPRTYDESVDCYFTVNSFSDSNRELANALPSRWLYADLDEANPECPDFVRPTICWETSPGRYQAMWLLTKRVTPESHSKLNQRVTYLTGADKGGWGLNKVLRIPGTRNWKRDGYRVRILWAEDYVYAPKDLADLLRHSGKAIKVARDLPSTELPKRKVSSILKARKVPKHIVRRLSKEPTPSDDRSKVLYKLEGDLIRAGLTPAETVKACLESPWNKFNRHRDGGLHQLWVEVSKHDISPSRPTHSRGANGVAPSFNGMVSFKDFIYKKMPTPRWAVESIWSEEAHGIIAGQAKSYKTLIALDLAVSVASGTNFLGRYPVPKKGPVIFVQAENQPGAIQDRTMRIANSRGLLDEVTFGEGDSINWKPGVDLPMNFVNNYPDFNLASDEGFEILEGWMDQAKPKLVVLDPWYLFAVGVDENSAREVSPILKGLMDLKQKYNCGTVLVHHYRKPKEDEGNDALAKISGTSVFGRWFQSALLVTAGDEAQSAVITPYHREFPPQGSIQVGFDLGNPESLDYDLDVTEKKDTIRTLAQAMVDLVESDPGISIAELSAQMDIGKERCRRMVGKGPFELRPHRDKVSLKGGRPPLGVWPS